MEKLLWNRCFICSSELEPEVAVADEDSDDVTQSQTKLGSNPKTVVKENQASPATKSCRNQRQNESPHEKAHSFSDSLEDERQQDFKLEPEDPYEYESSLYSSDEDQSDPTPAADKAPPKARRTADKSHEDILLHYLLTYCQQNRIIGKLLYDDIKKLRSTSSNYDGVRRGSPTLNRKCVISIQFCKSCDHLAKNLKHLHSQLEGLQINIINQLKIVKQAVINNSRQYGCNNEGMKSYFNKFEQWLNQKGTLPEDWDTGRKFLQVLQQFQTTVFESSTRMCDMQLELLLKFMGNSRVPPPPPVYKKRKSEKAPETEEQDVTDFDSNSEDEEEVSFEPDLLETDFDVTEDPLNLRASETKSDHKLMAERRKNRLVHKLNPQRRKNTRTVLAERIKKLKMMLQKKPFTNAIVQQSGEYRVTINQHSPSSPPQSPNENVKVIEFESYKPGYKLEVIKKVKNHKVTTITDAPFLARKFRREWTDRRKEKKLKRKGQMLCEICPYTTVGASRFEQHLREHETLEKKWKCPVCSKRFTTKQYYELHLIYYCGVELWRCDACEIAVNRKRISEHLKKRHEGSQVHNCQHCDLFYVNFTNLATHSLCHPGGFQSLKCQLCPPDSEAVPFTTKRSVIRHLVEEHDQTQLLIKCDYENCSATYFTGDLRSHKQTHLDIPSLRCSTCGKTFTSNGALQRHIKTRHLMEKIFECSKCSEKFTTMGQREKHLIREHGIANYKCDLCTNEVFSQAGSLRYHKQIKHNMGNIRQFQCDVCDRKFYYKQRLKAHEKTHSDSKDFTCEICGFATRTAGLLKSHIANHDENKIKNHSCEYCQKKFADKKVLQIHIRIHTLERPFQCDICGSTFNQQSALRVHKKKHVENKSFKPRPSRYLRKKKAMEMEESGGGVVVGIENNVPPVGNLNLNMGELEVMSTGKHHYVHSSSATSESTNRDQHQHLPHFATTSTNMSAVPSTSSGYPLNDI